MFHMMKNTYGIETFISTFQASSLYLHYTQTLRS